MSVGRGGRTSGASHPWEPGRLVPVAGEAAATAQGPEHLEAGANTPGQGGHAPHGAAPQAPETRRLYARDWAAFEAWCTTWGRTPLPAGPGSAAAYLAPLACRVTPDRPRGGRRERHHRAAARLPGGAPRARGGECLAAGAMAGGGRSRTHQAGVGRGAGRDEGGAGSIPAAHRPGRTGAGPALQGRPGQHPPSCDGNWRVMAA